MDATHDHTTLTGSEAGTGDIARSTAVKRRQTLARFDRWCRERGYRTMPATATVLEQYVVAHTGQLVYLTLRTRIEHLRAVHRAAGMEWPENDGPVRNALAKAKLFGTHRVAEPFREADLVDLGRHLTDAHEGEAVADWALLALGAEAGLDATELATLRPHDLDFDIEGDDVVVRVSAQRPWLGDVRISRRDHPKHCAIAAVEAWLAVREPKVPTLFYVVDADGTRRPLNPQAITAVVQRRMNEIGRRGSAYTWFSLRSTRLLAQIGNAQARR